MIEKLNTTGNDMTTFAEKLNQVIDAVNSIQITKTEYYTTAEIEHKLREALAPNYKHACNPQPTSAPEDLQAFEKKTYETTIARTKRLVQLGKVLDRYKCYILAVYNKDPKAQTTIFDIYQQEREKLEELM